LLINPENTKVEYKFDWFIAIVFYIQHFCTLYWLSY